MRKEVLSEEHLIESHPDGPNVGLTVVRLVVKDLRGHVERRTQDGLSSFVLGAQQFGEPEVPQLDDPVMFENVSEFEIPVHNFAFDEGLEGVQDLYEVLKSLFLRELFLGFDGCEQIALVTELEDEIDVVDSLLDVNEPDYIIILTTLQHLDLVLQQLRELAYGIIHCYP